MAEDTHEVAFETYEESWTGRIVIAAVVALALIAGAFFAGKAMAGDGGGGPATLAEAVQQAQKGTLPCGDTTAASAATPTAGGAAPAGAGGGFFLRGICNPNDRGAGTNGGGQGGRFGGRGFAGQTVTAVSADAITVEGPNGPATIKLDASTTVSKSSGASVTDIKKGDSVLVAGAGGPGQNTQGAAARSVTILPQSSGS